MITYRKGLLSIGELWFEEDPDRTPVDIVCYRFRTTPVDESLCVDFHTICVDLQQDEQQLHSNFKKYTQYEIRRAGNTDDLNYEFYTGNACQNVLKDFVNFNASFASQRRLVATKYARWELLADSAVLDISRVSKDGEVLVYHAFYRGHNRVQLLASPSHFRDNKDSAYRNFVGRAHRWQHWRDMLRYKADGVTIYDFGGWYVNETDPAKIGVNKFKEEFGGKVVRNFICKRAVSAKGVLALQIEKYFRQLSPRKLPDSLKQIPAADLQES